MFFNCVIDQRLSVCTVLRQFLGRELPLAVRTGCHSLGVDDLGAILNVNRDLAGQQLRAVLLQIPDLLTADRRGFRNVGVTDVVVGNNLAEAFRHFFIHRIGDDIVCALLVLRQIAGRVRPLVVRTLCYCQRFNDIITLFDVDRDAIRDKAFIIARHIPGLFAADFCRLKRVLHCVCEGSVRSLCNVGRVVRNRIFSDGIFDIFAARFLLQVIPCVRPVIGGFQFNRLFLCTICKQIDSNAGRTITIPIIAVLPDLLHTDIGLFSRVAVS